MTKLLEHAVDTVRLLSPKIQDELARLLLELAGEEQPAFPLTKEEEASFDESFSQAQRREFATDARIQAIWAKHGL